MSNSSDKVDKLLLRLEVENFLYWEVQLLDDWALEAWDKLFTDDGCYLVPPVGSANAESADPQKTLFIVADDREMIKQRTIRMMKTSAHVEYPRSNIQHNVNNVKIIEDDGAELKIQANFIVYRNRRHEIAPYMGEYFYKLIRDGDSFKIKEKRACLDLNALQPQGSLAIIL